MSRHCEIETPASNPSPFGRVDQPLELMVSSLALLLGGFGFLFLSFCL